MDQTMFPAWERAFSRKKARSLRPGNARLQKWRAWNGASMRFYPL